MAQLGFSRDDIKGTFHEVLDYTVVEWGDGHVLIEMEVKQEHRNLGGSVHGGVLASLVDLAGFLGGSYSPDGPGRAVTMNLNTSFIAGTNADVIVAEGSRVHATKGTLFSKVQIREKGTDKLLTTGQCTYKLLRADTKESPGVKK
ncbi:MAG: PaaI family thioesterase [Proteobacteria bacterium]|nr:PaaI family thioesterase [Pseudomonadota bacterium]